MVYIPAPLLLIGSLFFYFNVISHYIYVVVIHLELIVRICVDQADLELTARLCLWSTSIKSVYPIAGLGEIHFKTFVGARNWDRMELQRVCLAL